MKGPRDRDLQTKVHSVEQGKQSGALCWKALTSHGAHHSGGPQRRKLSPESYLS